MKAPLILKDCSELAATSSKVKILIATSPGSVSLKICDSADPKKVYGEVYLELYASELNVLVYDQNAWLGLSKPFEAALATFEREGTSE